MIFSKVEESNQSKKTHTPTLSQKTRTQEERFLLSEVSSDWKQRRPNEDIYDMNSLEKLIVKNTH